jgi:hypothetical protein
MAISLQAAKMRCFRENRTFQLCRDSKNADNVRYVKLKIVFLVICQMGFEIQRTEIPVYPCVFITR